jgi:hypothetical protein
LVGSIVREAEDFRTIGLAPTVDFPVVRTRVPQGGLHSEGADRISAGPRRVLIWEIGRQDREIARVLVGLRALGESPGPRQENVPGIVQGLVRAVGLARGISEDFLESTDRIVPGRCPAISGATLPGVLAVAIAPDGRNFPD